MPRKVNEHIAEVTEKNIENILCTEEQRRKKLAPLQDHRSCYPSLRHRRLSLRQCGIVCGLSAGQ